MFELEFPVPVSMSHPSSTFLLMKANDPGLDEIWKDFYATLPKSATDRSQVRKEREKLIHFAWFYNSIASTGTKSPVYDLARRLGVSDEEVGELVEQCLELRLLCAPKRGSNRCELSAIAVRMIGRMKIGLEG